MSTAPSAAIDWRSAPTRFSVPSVTRDGPNRMRSSEPTVPTWMRVPRGSVGEGAAMPQLVPRPGASVGARQRRAQHERIGAGGDGLGQLAAPAHAAVGDDRHVAAGASKKASRAAATSAMAVTCGTPMPSTSRVVQAAPGPDTHEDGRDALAHQLVGRVVRGRVADRDGDAHEPRELGQLERLVARGEVARGRDLRLDQEQVRAVLGAERTPAARRRRASPSTTAGEPAACSSRDAPRDEVLADGHLVGLREELLDLVVRGAGDALQHQRPGRRSAPGRPRG